MFNISVNLKDAKKVDHIMESSLDSQSLFDALYVIYHYRKSKTIFKSSLNSHVYWDTLNIIYILNIKPFEISIVSKNMM